MGRERERERWGKRRKRKRRRKKGDGSGRRGRRRREKLTAPNNPNSKVQGNPTSDYLRESKLENSQ